MSHPLDGAFARVERATSHIQELERVIAKFSKATEKAFVRQEQTHGRKLRDGQYTVRIRSDAITGQVPLPAAVVVGEVIYNLRAALDYLIFELAWKDSGVEQKGTQFPIQPKRCAKPPDARYGFSEKSMERLTGLSDSHIAAVEKLQPYAGCAWTKTLSDISNPDKHRRLTAVSGGEQGFALVRKGVRGTFDGYSGKTIRFGKSEINVHHQHAILVTLPDGMTPIIETLENLHREVAATIDAFKPEF